MTPLLLPVNPRREVTVHFISRRSGVHAVQYGHVRRVQGNRVEMVGHVPTFWIRWTEACLFDNSPVVNLERERMLA